MKIKSFASIIFILIQGILFSQNQRFIYEYTFKKDSLHRDNAEKEIMNLDVSKEGSIFYSSVLLARDSIFNAQFQRGKITDRIVIDMSKVENPKVNFKVSKTYTNLETKLHTNIDSDKFSILEINKINWTVLPETSNIAGLPVQKAKTKFGGRNWIAWFTTDIQIYDGPYKFCGLPGLILNLEDDKGDHVFKFLGSKNIKDHQRYNNTSKKEIPITKEKFNQFWNEYKKDPAKNLKLMHQSSDMSDVVIYNSDGSPISKAELIRNKEKRAKEALEKFNNFIEPEFYK